MDDYINRQEAIVELRDAENHAFNSFYDGLVKAHKIIADLPSVQPERKTGKWICIDEEGNTWQCTNCIKLGKNDWWQFNDGTPQDNEMDYCPHCGAKMGGEQDDD